MSPEVRFFTPKQPTCMCEYDDFGGYGDLNSYNGDPAHYMEVDYSYHMNTGELSDLFGDDGIDLLDFGDDDLDDDDDWTDDDEDLDEDEEDEEYEDDDEYDEESELDEEWDESIPYSGFITEDGPVGI